MDVCPTSGKLLKGRNINQMLSLSILLSRVHIHDFGSIKKLTRQDFHLLDLFDLVPSYSV
jgi:hypothetical protein